MTNLWGLALASLWTLNNSKPFLSPFSSEVLDEGPVLLSRGHLAMSRDILEWRDSREGRYYWHLMGRDWGWCQTSYKAELSSPNVSSAEVEKSAFTVYVFFKVISTLISFPPLYTHTHTHTQLLEKESPRLRWKSASLSGPSFFTYLRMDESCPTSFRVIVKVM